MRRFFLCFLIVLLFALPAASFAEENAADSESENTQVLIHPGDEGNDVLTMQTNLARLGYYEG